MEASMPTVPVRSSRPVPLIVEENEFQQRKRTPFRAARPPNTIAAKSCPPVSRIMHRRNSTSGPQLVSFKSERKKEDVLYTPHYNTHSGKPYLEQCFQLCDKLGEGSFGEVFRVCSREDGKMYAVKRSRQQFKGRKDRKQKLAEVQRHEHLPHHPNCIKFHKAWEEREKLYIQTELCQMSLAEYADLHGRVPEQRIWHILMDLAKGLKHLHDNRLCHLDIKPANIFLGDDNVTCKLGDFGLCSSLDNGFMDAMEGDAKYLAPELLNHQFGTPADIFSLGISLLELACEIELPSGGENWHLLRKGRIPPNLLTGLSPGLVDILSRMMNPDPEMRPTVDELLTDHCVLLASSKQSCFKACAKLISACKHVLWKILSLLMFLLSVLSVVQKDRSVIEDEVDKGGGGGGGKSLQNESFSEDEDELIQYSIAHSSEDIGDPSAKFNCSWIKNSPMKYPSPVYSGPPIPINFDDSSFDTSPEKQSPCRSHSSPHSLTPKSTSKKTFPRFRLQVTEPKNLMEVLQCIQ